MNKNTIYIFARVLIASVFVGLGAERILAAMGLFGPIENPTSAGVLAFSAFELVVGIMIMIGWQVRWLSLLMGAFLLIDAFLSHPFWAVAASDMHDQYLHFLKNMSAIGGLLLLSWVGNTSATHSSGDATP